MAEAPKRAVLFYGGPGTRAYWRPDENSMDLPDDAILPTHVVRADIADGYREALRLAIPHVEDNLADEQGFLSAKNTRLVKRLREALTKGDESDG